MSIVGIIANPASGKDIRRLVGQASVISNREKVNIVKRIIIGLATTRVDKILIMPDRFGIGLRAKDDLKVTYPAITEKIEIIPMSIVDSSDDSIKAAEMMRKNGAKAIITLGGDGTIRVVSKGAQQTPLLPISTGTNNVIPSFTEGTIAGLAAGKFACMDEKIRAKYVKWQKKIDVYINDKWVDLSLVDMVAVSGMHTGSRAVWDTDLVRQIMVTRANLMNIGFSNIIACFEEITPTQEYGMTAEISDRDGADGIIVQAVIGPGMISTLSLINLKKISIGEKVPVVKERPLVLVLDGEREHILKDGDTAYIQISSQGPGFIDIQGALGAEV